MENENEVNMQNDNISNEESKLNEKSKSNKENKSNKNKRTRKDKKTHKKSILKKVIIALITIVVLCLIAITANNYIILDKNTQTNLVINNNNITAYLKKPVLIEDDIIYLSKEDIANFFDKYIYEEKESNQIITTYDKKIAAIGYEENKIVINGSNKNIYAHAIKKDDTTYLPISEMKDVYNIEIANIENSKVVTMDSLDREQKKATVTSNLAVKSSTKFIAKTIDRVKKGESVVVISTEDGYAKIRTENGKVGYVKENKIDNIFLQRENMEEEKQIEGKVNLTWDYYSEYASAPDRSGTKIEGVNVVSPAFFYIDKSGNIRENIGTEGQKYIEWAHNNGYKIWPMLSNAEAAQESLDITSNIMNSYEQRQNLINAIVEKCVKYDLDGINLDFENMKQEDKDMYSRFIIELTPRMKEIGLVTSVDVTAPDGGETWSMCFNRNVIGDVADYIVFMAYDQNGVSSTKPGTTAGYDWIKLNLTKFLETEEIEPQKLIMAVPFYTRVWTTNENGESTSKSVAMKDIEQVVPSNAQKQWNDDLKQNYAEYTEGGKTKQIWVEDIESLKAKISLITEKDLAGVGSWAKDMETDDVWEMFTEELN